MIETKKASYQLSATVGKEAYEIIKRYAEKDMRTMSQATAIIIKKGIEAMGLK